MKTFAKLFNEIIVYREIFCSSPSATFGLVSWNEPMPISIKLISCSVEAIVTSVFVSFTEFSKKLHEKAYVFSHIAW